MRLMLITTTEYMANLVTNLIVSTLKLLGMKSYCKRVKKQSILKKSENVSLFEKKWQHFISLNLTENSCMKFSYKINFI